MKAVDQFAVKTWCEAHGFALDERGRPIQCGSDYFRIPNDAGARVALVKGDLRAFQNEDQICVFIDDWSVWPSGEWMHIFERFRLSYGITEPLIEKSGHIIQKEDFDAVTSLAIYSVLMLWDCYVLGSSGRTFLFYSHDEVGNKNGA